MIILGLKILKIKNYFVWFKSRAFFFCFVSRLLGIKMRQIIRIFFFYFSTYVWYSRFSVFFVLNKNHLLLCSINETLALELTNNAISFGLEGFSADKVCEFKFLVLLLLLLLLLQLFKKLLENILKQFFFETTNLLIQFQADSKITLFITPFAIKKFLIYFILHEMWIRPIQQK